MIIGLFNRENSIETLFTCKISAIFLIIAEILRNFAADKDDIGMKNYSQEIMDYAALHPNFGLQDLYAHFDGEAEISRQTVSWYLTKLTESGRLLRIGHGVNDNAKVYQQIIQ